jgi:hypothetical protein
VVRVKDGILGNLPERMDLSRHAEAVRYPYAGPDHPGQSECLAADEIPHILFDVSQIYDIHN